MTVRGAATAAATGALSTGPEQYAFALCFPLLKLFRMPTVCSHISALGVRYAASLHLKLRAEGHRFSGVSTNIAVVVSLTFSLHSMEYSESFCFSSAMFVWINVVQILE